MQRYVLGIASALAALNTFLIAYPGNDIPQVALLIVGGATAFMGALGAFLAAPAPPMEH